MKKKHVNLYFIISTFLFILFIQIPFLQAEQLNPGKAHGEDALYINWKRYYNHQELTNIYKNMVSKFPNLIKLVSTGKSIKGKDLWLLEITNFKKDSILKKPAMYIDGAIHGNEVQGTICSLYTAWYLITRYGHDKYVTNIMDNCAFYIKPAVNADAAHSFVSEPNIMHHPRRNYRPTDNDGDGKFDEDPEEDINGDGEISNMRRKNPNGRWKLGKDPRILVRCAPDEKAGGWEMLGTEGIDNDSDGRINEDIPGGVDLARNFAARWSISAGYPYPMSEPETRSTADYLLNHKNAGLIVHYHNMGKLIMIATGPYKKGVSRRSPFFRQSKHPTSVDKLMKNLDGIQIPKERQRDWRNLKTLARQGVEFTKYLPTASGGMGQFSAWAYEHFGAFTFLVELWTAPADFNEDGRIDQYEMLRWVDREFHGEGFIPWKPFNHPTLGKIEIGGQYTKFVRRTTPGKYVEQQAVKMNDWCLYLASQLPKIKISSIKIEPIASMNQAGVGKVKYKNGKYNVSLDNKVSDGTLVYVTTEVVNEHLLPTASQMAEKIKIVIKDELKLRGKGITVLGYAELDRYKRPIKFIKKKYARFNKIDGHETKRVRWLVKVTKDTVIEAIFSSVRGGWSKKSVQFKLKP